MTRGALAAAHVLFGLLLLFGGAGGCAEPAAPDRAAPARAPAGSLSLLAAFAEGRLEIRGKPDAAPGSAEKLLLEEFEPRPAGSPLPREYVSGYGLLALERGDASDPQRGIGAFVDPDAGGVAAIDPAAGALVRDLATTGDDRVRVRARVRRAAAGEPGRASLTVETLDRFFDALPPGIARNHKLALPPIERSDTVRETLLRPGVGWQELDVVVSPRAERAGIRITLRPDACGLLVDRLEMTALRGADALVVGPRDPDDPSSLPAARRVRLGDDVVDCLMLRAGERASIEVDVPARRPRLELLLAQLGSRTALPRLAVEVGGEPLASGLGAARASEPDAGPRFVPLTIDLERVASRRLVLELTATGAPGDLLLLGDPRLLATSEAPPPSVVLLSIDTLRADRVGGRPGGKSLTPRLDELARAGTSFMRATAASTWTLPSHAALFTGQFPSVHGAVDLAHRVDARRSPTLAVELAREGWLTAAFTGGVVIDPAFGFGAGFSSYSVRDPGMPVHGEDALAPALDWLARRADQPFFLFLHTYLVHEYEPSREWLERVAPGSSQALLATPRATLLERVKRGDAEAAAMLSRLYDATVAQADDEIVGRVMDALARLSLEERTIFCVVSDHGEEFLEHGGALHGETINGVLDRVPWILRGPGIEAGRELDEPVSHVDVLPTLLGRLGLAAPPTSQGVDVLARGERESERALLVELTRPNGQWDALVGESWKLVRCRAVGRARGETVRRLYRLDVDPGERDDLAAAQPKIVEQLERRLDHELAAYEKFSRALDAARDGESTLDPALLERLKRLGYVEDSAR